MPTRTRAVRSLLAGLAVVLPLAVLGVLGWQLLTWGRALTGGWVRFVGRFGIGGTLPAALVLLAGVGLLVVGLVAVGELVRHRYGSAIVGGIDAVVERVPGIGPIYRELRYTRAAITDGSDGRFSEVVLVRLSTDVDALAFVCGPASDGVSAALDRSDDDPPGDVADDETSERVAVYLPLAPNPTVGGHLFHVAADRLVETDVTVRQALTAILTLESTRADRTETPFEATFHQLETAPPVDERSPSAEPPEASDRPPT